MNKSATILTVLLFSLLALAGCQDRNEWRQKLTVSVDTPAGERSGASVIRVVKQKKLEFLAPIEARGVNSAVKGEATVVEIAPGRYLFALLGGQDQLAQKVFADRIGLDGDPAGYPEFEVWLERLAQLRERREVSEKLYPLLVTFRNIADPATVERVDLAASFGPGVSLKSITLEITDERVTKGRVEAVLGWLDDPKVMANPGWKILPIESRRAIGGLLSNFPKVRG